MSSITPTFRVELRVIGSHWTPAAWPTKHAGRPSDATLAAYVASLEASTRPGGVNAHLGETVVRTAKVVRQSTGDVVATYEAPLFAAVA